MTVGNDAHVHHLLIYLCEGLNDTHVGNGGDCEVDVANEVAECRGGTVIAAWAVGGEVCLYLWTASINFSIIIIIEFLLS